MLPCPPLPNIVAEWAAILPLVCHLASQRDDYITTGDVALLGRLSVGSFLGLAHSGIARLLRGRTNTWIMQAAKAGSAARCGTQNGGAYFRARTALPLRLSPRALGVVTEVRPIACQRP